MCLGKACILTSFMTRVSMAMLAAAVLWHSSPDYRLSLCVMVSLGAILLTVQALSSHKLMWGLVFLAVLGVFTPFRSSQFSHTLAATFDMATLALFAISPIVLRKAVTISSPSSVAANRPLIH